MVEKEDQIIEEEFEIDLQGVDGNYPGVVSLSEGGQLGLYFEEGTVPYTTISELQENSDDTTPSSWESIAGTNDQGHELKIEDGFIGQISNFSLTEVNIGTSATIQKNEDSVSHEEEEVIIDFDVVCFKTRFPPFDQMSDETKNHLNEDPYFNIPDEQEHEYFDNGTQKFSGVPFTDTSERIKNIKEEGNPLRTGKIRVRQSIPGTIEHQVSEAESEVKKVLEISSLVQETRPQFIRAKVVKIGDQVAPVSDVYYERLYPGSEASVGSRFTPVHGKNLWDNFPAYLEEAYENYTDHVRENLRLQQTFGYYVDARMTGRTVEGGLLSTCSAIELFSLWHAREDDVSEKTGPKIQHTISKLDVETDDLAEMMNVDTSQLNHPEYFWSKDRNHVVHGDPKRTTLQLWRAQQTTLIVLKRLIRNQLLDDSEEIFENLYNMTAPELVEF